MRLIDADALVNNINERIENMTNVGIAVDSAYLWALIYEEIKNAPTIEPSGIGKYENAMQKLKEMPKYLNGVKAKQIQKISAETEWIPCSEKLPKENAKYLVQMSYGIMRVLSWANNLEEIDDFDFYNKKYGGWYELDSEWGYCERHEVVAWMSLPKPYGKKEVK